jgi:hypothetical protein
MATGTAWLECLFMALRVISRRRSNSVAFGAKRTFSEERLLNRIYEYAKVPMTRVHAREY